MSARKQPPTELTDAQRKKLLELADETLRAPSPQDEGAYLRWFKGPVRKLVKAALGTPAMVRTVEASATHAIRVPSASKTKAETLESGPEIVHAPLTIIKAEHPEHPAEANALAGKRTAAFLQCSGANVLLILFRCFAGRGDTIPTWPGLDKLPEEPINERLMFDALVAATASAFTEPGVIAAEGARRTYIGEIIRGVRWLRRELAGTEADAGDFATWDELRRLQADLSDSLAILEQVNAADGRYPDELARARYRTALNEATDIRTRSGGAVPSPPRDAADPHVGLIALRDWCAEAQAAQGKESRGKTWQQVQGELLRMMQNLEPYTSRNDLGRRLCSSPSTVQRAIRKSDALLAWCDGGPLKSPKARSLNAVDQDRIAAEPSNPDEAAVENTQADAAFRRLLEEANDEERARLIELPEDKQRELGRLKLEQQQATRRSGQLHGRRP